MSKFKDYSLLKILELENRRIGKNDEVKLIDKKIEYENINNKLEKEREKSLKFFIRIFKLKR